MRERCLGRLLLGPQQLAQGMPPQIPQLPDVAVKCGDLYVLLGVLLEQEGDGLVEWPLHVELNLRVLIGGAYGLDRRGPDEDLLPREAVLLAQALGPELAEPVGHVAQAVRVGHHHVDRRTVLPVRQELQCSKHGGGVLEQLIRAAALVHLARPFEQLADGDPDQGCGEEAHCGKHREAPANSRRDGEGGDLLLLCELPQHPTLRIGGEEQVTAVPLFQLRLERLPHDQELAHRLRSAPGFRYHVEERAAQIHPTQEGDDGGRIDIVEHVEARKEVPSFVVEFVPVRITKRRAQRNRSECRAPDPQHHHVRKRLPDAIGKRLDLVHHVARIGQLVESQLSPLPPPLDIRLDVPKALRYRRESPEIDSSPPEPRGKHVVVVESDHRSQKSEG